MATHPHVVFFGDRDDSFEKVRDPLPIVGGGHSAGLSDRKLLPIVLELERLVGDSSASWRFSVAPDWYHRPVIADYLDTDAIRPPDVFANGIEPSIAFRAWLQGD